MTDRLTFRFFLLKIVFPLIYAGFFVVQLFINFDTALTQFSDRYQVIQYHTHANYPVALQKAEGSHPVKTKFRLNKKFQPAVVSTPVNFYSTPDIRFLTLQWGPGAHPFITNPLFDTRLLRGPPFVV